MKRKLTLAVMTALLTIGLSPVTSYADTVTLTLDNATQTVTPGGTATFSGTFTADAGNSGPVFLNEDAINGASTPVHPGDNYVDDSGFLFNFIAPLNPGDTASGVLFTITLPFDAPVGYVFSGTFAVVGGNDVDPDTLLTAPGFSVTVVAGSPVPEPSSLMLLGTGLSGVFVTLRRKSFRSAD